LKRKGEKGGNKRVLVSVKTGEGKKRKSSIQIHQAEKEKTKKGAHRRFGVLGEKVIMNFAGKRKNSRPLPLFEERKQRILEKEGKGLPSIPPGNEGEKRGGGEGSHRCMDYLEKKKSRL